MGLYVYLDVVSLEFTPPFLPLSLRNRTITRKMQYDAREEERKGEEEKKRHGTGTKEKNNTLFSYS